MTEVPIDPQRPRPDQIDAPVPPSQRSLRSGRFHLSVAAISFVIMSVLNIGYLIHRVAVRKPNEVFTFSKTGSWISVLVVFPIVLATLLIRRSRAGQLLTWVWGVVTVLGVLRTIVDVIGGRPAGGAFFYWSMPLVLSASSFLLWPEARAEMDGRS